MAQLWKLPVIYVCENNQYSEYTYFTETMAGELAARAAAFGIHVKIVDGQDVGLVYEAARALVERARRGEGPAFLICNTYRYFGHHVGDINRTYYRSKEEEQDWKEKRDPLKLFQDRLAAEGLADQGLFDQIQSEAEVEIEAAVEYALNAPYPDPSEVDQHVYAE